MTMELIDIVMVGQFATAELAYLSIGLMPFMPVFLVLLGLMMGTVVMASSAFGAGRYRDCGAAWRRSLPYALTLGVVGAIFSQFGEPILHLGGQNDELAHHGGRIMSLIGIGLPAYLLTISSSFFLEGIKRPKPVMVMVFISNVLNLFLNWVLIYGNLGMPSLGAEGSAITTAIIRWTGCIIIIAYILNMKDQDVFGVRLSPEGGWSAWVEQRRFGYSAAVSIGVESFAFACVGMFAGWLGKVPLAAYTITHNLITLAFMVSLGFGSSTTVRVGHFRGGGQRRSQRLAGWTGLALNSLMMILIGIGFGLFPGLLANAYSSDPEVVLLVVPLIVFCGYVILADGNQAVMVNALRGCGEKWSPPIIQSLSYLFVMIPVAWWLAIHEEGGVMGIYQAILAAGVVSVALMAFRFHRITSIDG